jgi:hypothetical protein
LGVEKPTRNEIGGLCDDFTILPFFSLKINTLCYTILPLFLIFCREKSF